MDVVWDNLKAKKNRSKHGIEFTEASVAWIKMYATKS